MLYLVTNQQRLFDNEIHCISVEDSLALLEPLTIVGLDTETKGLDPYTKELLSVQLGCEEFQIVIDCTTVDIHKYKAYLESDRLFLREQYDDYQGALYASERGYAPSRRTTHLCAIHYPRACQYTL